MPTDICDDCSLHWSDLHKMFYDQMPAGTVKFGHSVLDFKQSGDAVSVIVEQCKNGHGNTRFEITADLLVAAHGSNSTVRSILVPKDKRRCAELLVNAWPLQAWHHGLYVKQC